jgi:hypothetical protein
MRRAALLLAACATACSPILMTKAPSEPQPLRWPDCTEHPLFPIADSGITALAAGGTVFVLTSDDDLAPVGLIAYIPMLLGFGASAIYGFQQRERCVRAREAYEAARQGR